MTLVVCLATSTWPLVALAALGGLIFCAAAPRLRRRVRVRLGLIELDGDLDPFNEG